jgi:hypothetical protein
MAELFDLCVGAMYLMSDITGLTYKEINIWLFVIIHPVITLTLFILLIFKQRKINHYEKTYEMEWGQPTSIDGLIKYKENLKTLEDEDVEDLIEQDEDEDDLFKDWTPPSYEDVVDPEFDRGFNMAYDKAIGDVMNYLEDGKNYILIGDIRNYLQGLRDSDEKF